MQQDRVSKVRLPKSHFRQLPRPLHSDSFQIRFWRPRSGGLSFQFRLQRENGQVRLQMPEVQSSGQNGERLHDFQVSVNPSDPHKAFHAERKANKQYKNT